MRAISMGAIWLVAGMLPASALGIEFQASVDRIRSGETDPIQLTLTLRSDETLSHVPAPEISLKDFYVEGPAVSTRVEMVNFRTTFTRELTYTLYPRHTGRITIGPARLKLNGKVYETKPIVVEIVRGSTRQMRRPSASRSARSDAIEDNLFVRARADRDTAYVGQQITVDYELCYRYRLGNVGFKELPSFSGFWAKELFVAQQLQPRREVLGGVSFYVAPLKRMALFPTRPGTLRVEPMAVSCDILKRRRMGSLFDEFFADDPFFGSSAKTVLLRSNPLLFEVLPLPEQGRPAEFTGAVGRFELEVDARPTDLPVGDPVTLRVEISGQGNLETVDLPRLVAPKGVKVYDPKIEKEEKIENGQCGGRCTYEYILIPERGGDLEIPPVRFAYFDPDAGRYRLLESEPVRIHSRGGEVEETAGGYGLSRKEIEAVGRDIRYIKPDADELGGELVLYRSPLFWLFQTMIPVAFAGLFLFRRHQQRLEGDVAYARRRKARGEAHRRLRQARKLMEEEKGREFHAEVQRAVIAFLADRMNLSAAGLTAESSAAALEERGVDPALVEELRGLLTECDFARFAPVESSREEMEKVHERAGRILSGLEKVI